jgi:CheY-like chemotaxis protein
MLAIGDNGHGMDPGTQSLVFDPFFTTKQPGKGTGLGLTTVYDIIQQNHGIISISSEPAKGTTFTLHLKRFTGTPDPVFQEAPATSPPGGLETVLLVEDDPNFLEMTQRILQGLGYKVLISATGREAVRLAAANAGQIHLLITDVVMPDMNGPDLVQHLMPLYPTMRHLYMSGYSVEMIEQYGIPEAQAHFIEKPFSLNELAAKVREALTSESDLPAQQG